MTTFKERPEERLRAIIMKTGQCLMGITNYALTESGIPNGTIAIKDPVWVTTAGHITNPETADVVFEKFSMRPFFNDIDPSEPIFVVPDMVLSSVVPGRMLSSQYYEYLKARAGILIMCETKFDQTIRERDQEIVNEFIESLLITDPQEYEEKSNQDETS